MSRTHMAAVIGFLQRSQVFDALLAWWNRAQSRDGVGLRCMGAPPEESRARRVREEPSLAGLLGDGTSAGIVAREVRRHSRRNLGEEAASSERAASLIAVLRPRVPRDLAIEGLKVVSNAAPTTRRMGSRGAPSGMPGGVAVDPPLVGCTSVFIFGVSRV